MAGLVDHLELNETFTAVFKNGSALNCRLIEMGGQEILAETPQGSLLIPKRSILYCTLPKSKKALPAKKTKPAEPPIKHETLPVRDISVPGVFLEKPPSQKTIDKVITAYRNSGVFDQIVTVRRERNGWSLVAGIARYRAAEQLGLVEVPVIINRSKTVKPGKTNNNRRVPGVLPLKDIVIPKGFLAWPTPQEKIDRVVKSYKENGYFEDFVEVIGMGDKWLLLGGYHYYKAAEHLGLGVVQVKGR